MNPSEFARKDNEFKVEKVIPWERIKPNSVVVFKCEEQGDLNSFIEVFSDARVKNKIPEGTMIVVLKGDETFEHLTEEDMNKYGWYRK